MRHTLNALKSDCEKAWRDWKKQNQELYRQLMSVCGTCGATKGLQIHHKDGDKRHNELSNLVCLCWDCHRIVHMSFFIHYQVTIK